MVKKDDQWGYINKKGEEVVGVGKYNVIGDFSKGLARVAEGNKRGYINKKGEEVIKLKYDEVWFFSEGLVWVKKDGKWGVINKKGKEVIKVKLKYYDVRDFREGLAMVSIGNWETSKWGFINKKGKEVVEPKYDDASSFSEGIAPVREGDNWYIIDKKGKVIRKI